MLGSSGVGRKDGCHVVQWFERAIEKPALLPRISWLTVKTTNQRTKAMIEEQLSFKIKVGNAWKIVFNLIFSLDIYAVIVVFLQLFAGLLLVFFSGLI